MTYGSSGGGNNGGRLCPQGIETRVRLTNEIENRKELRVVVMDNCDRLAEVETVVNKLTYHIGIWAGIGMIIGGVAIQAFTKYVLNW